MKTAALDLSLALLKRVHAGRRPLPRLATRLLQADISRTAALQPFQRIDTREILTIILERFRKPQLINVLEVGCGAEVTKYVAGWVGTIVGINLSADETTADSCPANMRLQVMDGRQLTFPDRSFEFVFSANVNEHIGDLPRAIAEQVRVLRPGGYGYARWCPLWSSAKGHHIHDDMLERWERKLGVPPSNYRNDGSVIEDWSHLLLSQDEMRVKLAARFASPLLVERIVEEMYTRENVNRLFFEDVQHAFVSTFGVEIISWETGRTYPPRDTLAMLQQRHGIRDFSVASCQVLFRRAY